MSNENYEIDVGDALTISPIALNDDQGMPITAYDGSQSLIVTVWPGGTRAASFTFTDGNATWLTTTPNPNTCQIALTNAETSALIPGRYQLKLEINDAGVLVKAYDCTLEVAAVAGTDVQPPTYPYDPAQAYKLLLRYGRSWLTQLETSSDEAGFAEQMGRARTWLEDIGHAHWRVAAMTMVVGGQAFGPRHSGMRSEWLEDQFAANTVVVFDKLAEACAKMALALICEGQLDGDPRNKYARLARMYRSQAEAIASCLTIELDTNGDGFSDTVIDCTCSDPMDA